MQYTEYLKANYSEELIILFSMAIKGFTHTQTGRHAYSQLVGYLNTLASPDNGLLYAKVLVSDQLLQYNNRRAMKEELKKFNTEIQG